MTLIDFDPNQIQDLEGAQKALVLLLNLVEEVKTGKRPAPRNNTKATG